MTKQINLIMRCSCCGAELGFEAMPSDKIGYELSEMVFSVSPCHKCATSGKQVLEAIVSAIEYAKPKVERAMAHIESANKQS